MNAAANAIISARVEHSAARRAKNDLGPVGGVDRGERPLGGQHLPEPDPGAVRPELSGERDQLGGDMIGQRARSP